MERCRRSQAEQGLPLLSKWPGTGLARPATIAEAFDAVGRRIEKQFTDPHFGFVQLRFGVAGRATEESSNLLVLIALDLVQQKNRPVSFGQLPNRLNQSEPV